jgi:3-hydroxybutyrate dehydrogenase
MTDLSGKTALVTGSVQGIGLAIAEALAGRRRADRGARARRRRADRGGLPPPARQGRRPQAEFFDGDLRNPDRIDRLMQAVAAWGGADILVNNAGIQHTAPLAEMPREKWDAILA